MLTHEAAAAVFFWPKLPVPTVRCSVRHRRPPQPGYEFSRGRIPPELVWQYGRLTLTAPALTALDLCERLGGEAIDQALLSRSTTLLLLHEALALTGGRTGNPTRRQLLLDSRDEPWSEAERDFHRLLRAAGITGWKGNRDPDRRRKVYADVMFRRLRLVIEVDGREFHSKAEVFESDRHRQNCVVTARGGAVTWAIDPGEPDRVIAWLGRRGAAAMSRSHARNGPLIDTGWAFGTGRADRVGLPGDSAAHGPEDVVGPGPQRGRRGGGDRPRLLGDEAVPGPGRHADDRLHLPPARDRRRPAGRASRRR